jgi:hypothetical protein
MKRTQAGKIWPLLAVLVAGLVLGYLIFGPTEENLDEALEKEHVRVSVKAKDETAATFSVGKLGVVPANLTVVIPPATPIRNRDAGGQSLLTGKPVVIRLGVGEKHATQTVETYCLNQFALPPTLNSALEVPKLVSGRRLISGDYSREELEPWRKLVDCLARQREDRGDRQLVIWMFADNLTGKSYKEVASLLRRKYEEQFDTQVRSEFRNEHLGKLREKWPNLDEQRLREEVAYYERNTLKRRIAEQAKKETETKLRRFVTSARPLLDRCGYNTADMQFFRTAPPAS